MFKFDAESYCVVRVFSLRDLLVLVAGIALGLSCLVWMGHDKDADWWRRQYENAVEERNLSQQQLREWMTLPASDEIRIPPKSREFVFMMFDPLIRWVTFEYRDGVQQAVRVRQGRYWAHGPRVNRVTMPASELVPEVPLTATVIEGRQAVILTPAGLFGIPRQADGWPFPLLHFRDGGLRTYAPRGSWWVGPSPHGGVCCLGLNIEPKDERNDHEVSEGKGEK